MPRKKREHEYKVSDSYGVIREQLGLPVYPHKEEAPTSLEVPKSEHPRISFLNDIDVTQWKAYDEIITDSLWLIGSRDKAGAHTAELHGNFIPQIPHQAMLPYTK